MHSEAPALLSSRILALAVWFGLFTGLLEVALLAVKKFHLHRVVRVSPHVVWMAPLADIVIFSVIAVLVIVVAKWRPRLAGYGPVIGVFAFLSFFTLTLHYTPIHLAAKALLAVGVGVQSGRWAAAHPGAFASLVSRTLGWTGWMGRRRGTVPGSAGWAASRHIIVGAVLVLVSLFGVVSARAWAMERARIAALPESFQGRNILLIVWDTVRARSLGLYGYERRTTPQLEDFARDAVVFERAFATAPWTLPTHASMFTGRWHHEISADWDDGLDREHPTLAEFLGSRGYTTAGFVANTFYGSFEHGLNRGFARYEDYRISPGQIFVSSALGNTLGCGIRNVAGCRLRGLTGYHDLFGRKTAAHVNGSFLGWLDERDESRPFFAFLNYFDAHAPYLPPEPYASQYAPGPRGNPMQLDIPGWTWTPEEVRAEQDAYEGAIAYLDAQLGVLFDELDARGLLDETIVVVTSDHGEEFLEHGVMAHSNSLYMPSLHVPLVIRAPGMARPTRIAEPASVRDLPATLMQLLGIRAHPFPGRPLLGPAPEVRTPEVLHADLTGLSFRPATYPVSRGDMRSVVIDPYHYIRDGDGREEIYDIRNDPLETLELSADPGMNSARALLREAVDRRDNGLSRGGGQ
ncbi:MAG TPA: sulfatase [Longimicrobiales bacterium]|nr:sulfatase [Longimicrobiales bacterium]